MLSSYKPVTPDKLYTSKIQEWAGIEQTFPFQKRKKKIGKKEGMMDPKQVQNVARQISSDLKAQK